MLANLKFSLPARLEDSCFTEQDDKTFLVRAIKDSDLWRSVDSVEQGQIINGCETIRTGIYENGFNFDHCLDEFSDHKLLEKSYRTTMGKDGRPYKTTGFDGKIPEEYWETKRLFGVADNIEQIENYFKPAIETSYALFVIGVAKIVKSEEPECGGWRWHKWGEYIGKQDPQCEYIADEPEIKEVYCFHGYYVVEK